MGINKTSIPNTARVNSVAQKFANTQGKLRLKDGVIFHKWISSTEILAKLGHTKSKQIRDGERQAYKQWLEDSLAMEYQLEHPDAIKLNKPHGLSGQRAASMRSSAAVAKAAEDLNVAKFVNEWAVSSTALKAMLTGARQYVDALDSTVSAEDRIHAAKIYLVQCLVNEALPDLSDLKKFELKLQVGNFYTSPVCSELDEAVVKALVMLLSKDSPPERLELDGLVLTERHKLKQRNRSI